MNPFDALNAINNTKEDLLADNENERKYPAFMVNRGLSYFADTARIANEMNMNAHLDNRLQFDFLINMVRKRKRFSKSPPSFGTPITWTINNNKKQGE